MRCRRDRRKPEGSHIFGRPNQLATIAGFNVRVKDEREKDRNHLIEITLEVPLTHELADEILPAMARDLFQEVGSEWTPKPEIQDAAFNLSPETQLLTVRTHPDIEPVVRVSGVALRKIKAKKTDANSWVLQVTASWQLGVDTEATALIRALKSGVYVTFEVQQPTMLDPGQAPDNGQDATVDGQTGNVTKITDRKGKKGRKRSPEAEAEAQAEHGQAVDESTGTGGN